MAMYEPNTGGFLSNQAARTASEDFDVSGRLPAKRDDLLW